MGYNNDLSETQQCRFFMCHDLINSLMNECMLSLMLIPIPHVFPRLASLVVP